jgi:hypothetical protein
MWGKRSPYVNTIRRRGVPLQPEELGPNDEGSGSVGRGGRASGVVVDSDPNTDGPTHPLGDHHLSTSPTTTGALNYPRGGGVDVPHTEPDPSESARTSDDWVEVQTPSHHEEDEGRPPGEFEIGVRGREPSNHHHHHHHRSPPPPPTHALVQHGAPGDGNTLYPDVDLDLDDEVVMLEPAGSRPTPTVQPVPPPPGTTPTATQCENDDTTDGGAAGEANRFCRICYDDEDGGEDGFLFRYVHRECPFHFRHDRILGQLLLPESLLLFLCARSDRGGLSTLRLGVCVAFSQ